MNSLPPAAPAAELERLSDLLDAGRIAEASALAAALRQRHPHDVEATRLHAIAQLQSGDVAAARASLESALRLDARAFEVLCNLGVVLLMQDDAAGAIRVLEQADAIAPGHPAVLNGLGNARRAGGDLDGSRRAYAAATHAAPDYAGAWLNLAAAELALGEHVPAHAAVRRALLLAPGYPQGLLLLGHVLAAQGRFAEAEAAYADGERAAPDDARFAYQIGLMAEEQRKFEDAAAAHARALARDPTLDHALAQLVFLRRQLCDWRDLDALSTRLRARVAACAAGIAPFGFLAEPASAAEQLRCARTFAAAIEANAAPLRAALALPVRVREPTAPLRVGFVSNGFGNHPTGLLTVAFIEALREQPIEVHLFATSIDDGSAVRRRLRAATTLHEVADCASAPLARRIHAADVEILVDLRGYGGGSVAETLALRPAPLQVGWLAYPGTSGAPWLDYVIADRIVLPDAMRAHFSECVAWLPRCFQPSDTTRAIGPSPPRSACGLPEHGVVYACFNNSYKINPATFARMLAVLRAVPGAVLWLLGGPGRADERLRAEAGTLGIDPNRLVFADKRPHAEYLARYRHADLFLDSAPYNAHTTASDAIWAGCPVLTVPGATFAARVAASLNHHLGLARLNAGDDETFVRTAVQLGSDAAARQSLRAEVAARRGDSTLFDMRGFAADFAALLGEMARRRRAGLAPAALG